MNLRRTTQMLFHELYWHDAIIKHIRISREQPGDIDEIELDIHFPDEETIKTLIFEKVYQASLHLNLSIISDETVLSAQAVNNSDALQALYASWKGRLDEVSLQEYRIQLNSTGGNISIISAGFSFK